METSKQGWQLARTEASGGTGNWRAFKLPMEAVQRASEQWRAAVGNADRLWLCWNVNSRWCLLQQKLVTEAGWVPVVGWDPNCGEGPPPAVLPNAIAIDFNALLGLPALFMHVPLEFAFLWCRKLAFWHSDLLLDREQMRDAATRFEALQDGEIAAVYSYGGLKNLLRRKSHRYFELLGCTTRGASQDQFEKGCGWWRGFDRHVNAPTDPAERARREGYYREHGIGIRYWEEHCGGKVQALSERAYARNHFSVNTVKQYRKGRNKSEEMEINFDLDRITRDLGIHDLLMG